jgi:2-amino-4-hydroxy-6-hydroxymethyldihydropteridine diphosphokinase
LIAYLGLGTNSGDRNYSLVKVKKELIECEIFIINSSTIYESKPMYNENQPNFYNQVLKVNIKDNPLKLLSKIKNIEIKMGRNLSAPQNSQRIIDIDILAIEHLVYEDAHLHIPHPLIYERKFVLEPWNEISPNFIIPKIELTVNSVYKKLNDNVKLKRIDEIGVLN